MKTIAIKIEDAPDMAREFPCALIYHLSTATMGPPPAEIQLDDIVEAHFFDSDRELRLISTQMGLEAYLLTEEVGDRYINFKAKLIPKFGKSMTIRKYIETDADGQSFIAAVRIVDWKGGTADA